MKARLARAQKHPGALAECLLAWSRGEDEEDAQVGAFAIAEFVLLARAWLTKSKR